MGVIAGGDVAQNAEDVVGVGLHTLTVRTHERVVEMDGEIPRTIRRVVHPSFDTDCHIQMLQAAGGLPYRVTKEALTDYNYVFMKIAVMLDIITMVIAILVSIVLAVSVMAIIH